VPDELNQDGRPALQSMATLGGGCFWCVEAVYLRVAGVSSVVSGYAGGSDPNPTYETVCSGRSGHAEVVQVAFDADVVSYERILELFWHSHDPTTLNRQGHDVGTQYRSIILTHDDYQQRCAEASREEAGKLFRRPIVTEIVPLQRFHAAESYHQDYYARNSRAPYCRVVIEPKLRKLTRQRQLSGG
jgi:peptide-methionine (S)-S-oxide reductase